MSKKVRKIERRFKVFCEGDTEYNYIDEMRKQHKYSIAIKPINMKGGGYSHFLDELKTDGNANCLAKFIIIDGDRAVNADEKPKLRELLEYCDLQNKSGRTPHIVVVNYPDFEYVACLHTEKYKGQDATQYIIKEMGYTDIEDFKADKKIYTVLTTKGNSVQRMLEALKNKECFVVNSYKVNKRTYDISVKIIWDWEKFGRKGSNIKDFFDVIACLDNG